MTDEEAAKQRGIEKLQDELGEYKDRFIHAKLLLRAIVKQVGRKVVIDGQTSHTLRVQGHNIENADDGDVLHIDKRDDSPDTIITLNIAQLEFNA